MQPAEAIGILRSEIGPSSVLHREIAENMGADALKAWEWVERTGCQLVPAYRPKMWGVLSFGDNSRLGYGSTPLAAVLDAIAKEGKG